MLIEEKVHFFCELGEMTIESAQQHCLSDFYGTTKSLIYEGIEAGLKNYEIFRNRCSRKILYNNKNIIFKEFLTNLKILDGVEISYLNSTQNTFEPKEISSQQINEFYGVGEFPFMTFTVSRIGNKDYFFYTITR